MTHRTPWTGQGWTVRPDAPFPPSGVGGLHLKRFVILTALLLTQLAGTLSADDLYLMDGREPLTGVVVQNESFARVEYRRRSVTQKVDSKEILSIHYGRTNKDYVAAVAARDGGDMLAAAQLFLNASEDEGLSDFVRATALAECGDALLTNNNFVEAEQYFTELLTMFPNTRHLARALLGKGSAQFMQRKTSDAEATFQTLKSEVGSKDLGEAWDLEADFFLLWVAEAKGEKGVIDGYQDLRERAKADYPSVSNKCALRIGRVQLANEDVAAARPYFEEIIESRLTTDVTVVAGAFNGRGRCIFAEAQAALQASRDASSKRDSVNAESFREDALADFREARLDFLRVQTVYRGVAREQPEALYWGAQCFLNVAGLDGGEDDAERLGKILLKRCKDGYGESEWGQRAAAEL